MFKEWRRTCGGVGVTVLDTCRYQMIYEFFMHNLFRSGLKPTIFFQPFFGGFTGMFMVIVVLQNLLSPSGSIMSYPSGFYDNELP